MRQAPTAPGTRFRRASAPRRRSARQRHGRRTALLVLLFAMLIGTGVHAAMESYRGAVPEKSPAPDPFTLETLPSFAAAVGPGGRDGRQQFFSSHVPFGNYIHESAERHDVDPALVAAMVAIESSFRRGARSGRGAIGLMQLMPSTAEWLGVEDPFDPRQNIDGGVRYLRYLDQQVEGDLRTILAAYNAGEGNVRRYGGSPPFPETREFVRRVRSEYDRNVQEIRKYREGQRQTPAEN